jgi:hypothetical protein
VLALNLACACVRAPIPTPRTTLWSQINANVHLRVLLNMALLVASGRKLVWRTIS